MRAPSGIRVGSLGLCLMLLFALAACGGGGSGSSSSNSSGGGTTSQTPTANAGPDQTSTTGATVTLNGSSSTDPAGKNLTYQWAFVSMPSGSTATLSNATSAIATFVPDLAGTYTVSLVVNNGSTSSAADDATITVTSSPDTPTANAGPDQNGSVGAPATLDGSGSSDPKGATLTYAWQIASAPSGSSATLSDATSTKPTFTPDVDGIYIFSLTVNNGSFTSAADTMTLSTVWMLNTNGAVAAKLKDSTGNALPVNVQSVNVVNSGGT
ncbi:MAG TPA: PKD domain-containing protein, partial [Gammaproteobacteria bacterium]